MSTPIGFKGVARLTNDRQKVLNFPLAAATTKTLGLDPLKAYDIYFGMSSPTDVTISVTSDDPQAVANGYAVYGAPKAYTTLTADAIADITASGVTGIQVTATKNGATADDATKLGKLGARFQVRAAEKYAGQGTAAQATLGTYSAETVAP